MSKKRVAASPVSAQPLSLADIKIRTPKGDVYAGQELAYILFHVGGGQGLAERLHGVVDILAAEHDDDDAELVAREFLRMLADGVYATDEPDSVTGTGAEGYARACRIEIVARAEGAA